MQTNCLSNCCAFTSSPPNDYEFGINKYFVKQGPAKTKRCLKLPRPRGKTKAIWMPAIGQTAKKGKTNDVTPEPGPPPNPLRSPHPAGIAISCRAKSKFQNIKSGRGNMCWSTSFRRDKPRPFHRTAAQTITFCPNVEHRLRLQSAPPGYQPGRAVFPRRLSKWSFLLK
jgi:hypothetical protein